MPIKKNFCLFLQFQHEILFYFIFIFKCIFYWRRKPLWTERQLTPKKKVETNSHLKITFSGIQMFCNHCFYLVSRCFHHYGSSLYFFFSFIFISWRLITLQYCSGFCHTLTWISHGFTCVPHPDPPSGLPPHPIPLGLPSAPAPSTCLMHPTWAGDLFHLW